MKTRSSTPWARPGSSRIRVLETRAPPKAATAMTPLGSARRIHIRCGSIDRHSLRSMGTFPGRGSAIAILGRCILQLVGHYDYRQCRGDREERSCGRRLGWCALRRKRRQCRRPSDGASMGHPQSRRLHRSGRDEYGLVRRHPVRELRWNQRREQENLENMCRRYEKERATPRLVTWVSKRGRVTERIISAGRSTVRRELGVLQAALNHCHSEGLIHSQRFVLPKPKEGESRDRWLTNSEVARLLWYAAPHIRRWILISLYMGRRERTVLSLPWDRINLVDKEIRFAAPGEVETNKRRGRAKIPRQLLGHFRRWRRMDPVTTHPIMFHSKAVDSVKKGFARASQRAGLEESRPTS